MKHIKFIVVYLFIALLSVVSLKYVLFSTYIKTQKISFRTNAIKNNINELKKIYFTQEEFANGKPGFEWKKNKKEIVINGQYHEVLLIKEITKGYQITIIPDKAENDLFQKFFNIKNQTEDNNPNSITAFLALVFIKGQVLSVTSITCGVKCQIFYKQIALQTPYMQGQIKPPIFNYKPCNFL